MKKLTRILLTFLGVLLLGEIADLAWLDHVRATITSATSSVTIGGNGSQTVFNFSFINGNNPADIVVIYTDASGNQTTLTQTQYTLTLTAPTPGSIWGIGGSVTYPLVGSPIALGTTLTILRSLPLQQTVSSNQGQAFPLAVETALDLLEMQIQQVDQIFSRALVQPITDAQSLAPLPAAAARANLGICFDSTGYNPIACLTPSGGIISSAMQPVVDAATLAAGRTAFGLGPAATLTPNYGLQSGVSGAGNLDANFTTVQDAISQSVTASFHMTQRLASGALTYTLPHSTTLWNGFGFWVIALTSAVTFSPNVADNFAGMSSGGAYIVPVGTSVFVTTNASGTWWAANVQRIGLNSALNLQINTSIGSNALTVALKDANGNDPSATSPTLIAFRSSSLTSGAMVVDAIETPLSMTVASGNTMGCQNNVTCRLWIFGIDNAGTVALCLYNATVQTGTISILGLDETSPATSQSGTSGGSSAQLLYCSTSAVTTKSVRVLGYIDISETTAGTWALGATKVQIFGPGVPRAGQTIQSIFPASNAISSQSITPQSAANVIKFSASVNCAVPSSNSVTVTYKRASATLLSHNIAGLSATSSINITDAGVVLDVPGAASSTSYSINISAGTCNSQSNDIVLDEIMGALDPANDDIPQAKAA